MNRSFKYHARDMQGAARDGVIEASDESQVVRKIQEQGLIVISVEAVETGNPETTAKSISGMPTQERLRGATKKCPYCAEEIRNEAILCRFCGKSLQEKTPKAKWYFKDPAVITTILCLGPLALPLVWFNPRYSRKTKIIVSVIVIILSWFIGSLFMSSLRSLKQYYGFVFQSSL
jgi:hypothetical protein